MPYDARAASVEAAEAPAPLAALPLLPGSAPLASKRALPNGTACCVLLPGRGRAACGALAAPALSPAGGAGDVLALPPPPPPPGPQPLDSACSSCQWISSRSSRFLSCRQNQLLHFHAI